MRYYSIDDSKSPIIIIQIHPVDPTPKEFDEYVEKMKALASAENGIVLIHNVTEGKFLTSEQRIKIGSLYKIPNLSKALLGHAFVNSALLPMTILKGIFLVSKPPVDHIVVKTEAEAINWAQGLLDRKATVKR